jgi:hypothetical protein
MTAPSHTKDNETGRLVSTARRFLAGSEGWSAFADSRSWRRKWSGGRVFFNRSPGHRLAAYGFGAGVVAGAGAGVVAGGDAGACGTNWIGRR